MNKINVLMITGVYLPELNGAVLQCNQIVKMLSQSVNFSILAGTNHESERGHQFFDGIKVYKAFMPRFRILKFLIGAFLFYSYLLKNLRYFDLIHIHGYSKRNAIIILIGKIFKKKVIIKLTSIGVDDPCSIKKKSYILWRIFKFCDAYICISPAFYLSYINTGLSDEKYNFIPNGVDLDKYHKISLNNKNKIREKFGISEDAKIIIFIGHFSMEKRPILLYKSWIKLSQMNPNIKLLLIGRTKNDFEVNEEIVETIKLDAIKKGVISQIIFVEETTDIDMYLKISDVFALPSSREGLPNVLLEAMACSLPCVVSNLPGVTDWLIDDGLNGLLFQSEDTEILAKKIEFFITKEIEAQIIGDAARIFVEQNFSCTMTSKKVMNLYIKTLGVTPSSN